MSSQGGIVVGVVRGASLLLPLFSHSPVGDLEPRNVARSTQLSTCKGLRAMIYTHQTEQSKTKERLFLLPDLLVLPDSCHDIQSKK